MLKALSEVLLASGTTGKRVGEGFLKLFQGWNVCIAALDAV
jgi:hypothetical protein